METGATDKAAPAESTRGFVLRSETYLTHRNPPPQYALRIGPVWELTIKNIITLFR